MSDVYVWIWQKLLKKNSLSAKVLSQKEFFEEFGKYER